MRQVVRCQEPAPLVAAEVANVRRGVRNPNPTLDKWDSTPVRKINEPNLVELLLMHGRRSLRAA
jgi:hypothetical protein